MSDPGLTNRLRQRSRRAGLAVGLSMALTIAVCIGSFAWIYAKADPLLSDLVGHDTPEARRTATVEASATTTRGGGSNDKPTAEPTDEPEPEPTDEPTPLPTPTEEAFRETHISNPDLQINLRPQPSTDGEPVAVLGTGTPLQYLNEQQTGDDGFQWFKFRTEDGLEGWLREGTFQET